MARTSSIPLAPSKRRSSFVSFCGIWGRESWNLLLDLVDLWRRRTGTDDVVNTDVKRRREPNCVTPSTSTLINNHTGETRFDTLIAFRSMTTRFVLSCLICALLWIPPMAKAWSCSSLPRRARWSSSQASLRTVSSQSHGSVSVTSSSWSSLLSSSSSSSRSKWNGSHRTLSMSAGFNMRTTTSLTPVPENAHRVVLMRHGESAFNNANIFTGWCDVELTQRGVVEANEAGQVFASHGLTFRKCYTSLLTRSIVTAHRTLEAAGVSYTPLQYDWRWNERHYGALQGLSKERTADRLGRTLVMQWRRSYEARPPLMTTDHPHFDIINRDPRYRKVENIPLGESLEDCQQRVVEVWNEMVQDVAQASDDESKYSMVVAHANTLRALVMHLDDIPKDEIEGLNIPTAIPFYYDVDKKTGVVLSTSEEENTNVSSTNNNKMDRIGLGKFRGIYISDERKKRSFLERRRAANDPWLWALHDHQVAREMLLGDDETNGRRLEFPSEGLVGLEEEAKKNTELFSSALKNDKEMSKVNGF